MKNLTIILMLVMAGFLAGCNTVSGAGKDIKATGDKIEEVAEDTREKIKD